MKILLLSLALFVSLLAHASDTNGLTFVSDKKLGNLSNISFAHNYQIFLTKEKTDQLVASVKTGKPQTDCYIVINADGSSVIHAVLP